MVTEEEEEEEEECKQKQVMIYDLSIKQVDRCFCSFVCSATPANAANAANAANLSTVCYKHIRANRMERAAGRHGEELQHGCLILHSAGTREDEEEEEEEEKDEETEEETCQNKSAKRKLKLSCFWPLVVLKSC